MDSILDKDSIVADRTIGEFVKLVAPRIKTSQELSHLYLENASEKLNFLLEDTEDFQDFLGNAYELSKEREQIKRSSERNQHGVYYSPQYLIRFMIDWVLPKKFQPVIEQFNEIINRSMNRKLSIEFKRLAENISNIFHELTEITVLDPSFGSGLFLVYAFRYIYDIYTQINCIISSLIGTLENNENHKGNKESISQIRDILQKYCPWNPVDRIKIVLSTHVFGADQDSGSLDIAKINIIIEALRLIQKHIESQKILEKTKNSDIIDSQQMTIENLVQQIVDCQFFTSNLKCGNSLLTPTILDETSWILEMKKSKQIKSESISSHIISKYLEWINDKDIKAKIKKKLNENITTGKAFGWVSEFYTNFFMGDSLKPVGDRGFTIIVGNPPWGSLHGLSKDYLQQRFNYKIDNVNSFELFIILSFELLKDSGILSFILPRNLLKTNDYKQMREILLNNYKIKLIAECGVSFKNVSQETIILATEKSLGNNQHISFLNNITPETVKNKTYKQWTTPQTFFLSAPDLIINPNTSGEIEEILKKIENHKDILKLTELVNHGRGIEYGKTGEVILCNHCSKYSSLPKKKKNKKLCPHCEIELDLSAEKYKIISETKDNGHKVPIFIGKNVGRYTLEEPLYLDDKIPGIHYKNQKLFSKKKILIMKISDKIKATIDYSGAYITQALYYLIEKEDKGSLDQLIGLANPKVPLEQILGIINSKLIAFYYEHRFNIGAGLTTNVTLANILRLPIHTTVNDQLIDFTRKIIELNQTNQSKSQNQIAEITKLDENINEIVYKMYGISEKEKAIIEFE